VEGVRLCVEFVDVGNVVGADGYNRFGGTCE